jgi:hypothetical protein
VFTIASKNYLAYARALLCSVALHQPDTSTYLFLADEPEGCFGPTREAFTVIGVSDLSIPSFNRFAFKYSVLELNTAVKPYAFRYLFEHGYTRVVYFDPDIVVYCGLGTVFEPLERHPIVLIPHITAPVPDDGLRPDEREFTANGTYNLGFLGLSDAGEAQRLLNWWSDRCHALCYEESQAGLFVDQKWMDLVPGLFDAVCILRHRGCNVAYWNLHERRLNGLVLDSGEPLVFYHFSGVSIGHLDEISRYQNRYTLTSRPDLKPLFESYREQVLANGYRETHQWQYKYGRYDNGAVIGQMARWLYPAVQDRYPEPFSTGPGSYYRLLQRKGLLEKTCSGHGYSSDEKSRRTRQVDSLLRLLCRLLGPDKYRVLMGYMRRASIIRTQRFLLSDK